MNLDDFIKYMDKECSDATEASENSKTAEELSIYLNAKGNMEIFKLFAQALKTENTDMLRAMPCSCTSRPDVPVGTVYNPQTVARKDIKCHRCKLLAERNSDE